MTETKPAMLSSEETIGKCPKNGTVTTFLGAVIAQFGIQGSDILYTNLDVSPLIPVVASTSDTATDLVDAVNRIVVGLNVETRDKDAIEDATLDAIARSLVEPITNALKDRATEIEKERSALAAAPTTSLI